MHFYITNANLTIDVENRTIVDITRGKSDANAIELNSLDVTFDAVHIDRSQRKLHLDGLAIATLAGWLHCERPASFKAEWRRFMKLFPGASHISDLMLATFRIVLGREDEACGEASYFVGKVRNAHPIDFAILRAGWVAITREPISNA